MLPTHCIAAAIMAGYDIKASAKQLAADLMAFYHGNELGKTPGILPGPPPAGDYYWWEAGAMWGAMIDYWHLTGDDTYNDITKQSLLFQVGPDEDYQPPNYTASLGNDDQAFWGMSVMLAAEENFGNPAPDEPQWLALAQAVFNTQAAPDRHDATCNGGLRWQIPLSNNGYDYKNSIANGCFFNLGARLARYTHNQTYADWAEKTWGWVEGVGFITSDYAIYDGAHVGHNCTDINKAQFSYNNAVFLLGAAYMYNYTNGSAIWEGRVAGLLNATLTTFFPGGIAYEIACESHSACTTDMLSFKGYLHRWLATTTQIAPFTKDQILGTLRTSAEAAVAQCTGGDTGRVCGFKWSTREYDGTNGVGQTMNVLGAVSSLLIDSAKVPLTNKTGGTSVGNPNAGSSSHDFSNEEPEPPSIGDKAGAGMITLVLLGAAMGMFGWISIGAPDS